FLQYCVVPRCLFSAVDAVYCTRFVKMLHELNAPDFSTLQFMDRVVKELVRIIICCTEAEANRFGRFLRECLTMVAHWMRDRESYERECMSQVGFALSMARSRNTRIGFDEYVGAAYAWHVQTARLFLTCLASAECKLRGTVLF